MTTRLCGAFYRAANVPAAQAMLLDLARVNAEASRGEWNEVRAPPLRYAGHIAPPPPSVLVRCPAPPMREAHRRSPPVQVHPTPASGSVTRSRILLPKLSYSSERRTTTADLFNW